MFSNYSNKTRGVFYFMFSTFFLFNSCAEKDTIAPNPDFNTIISPRSTTAILHDSIFELHNDFILWVFDTHMDSALFYHSDPADFMDFASRKWFAYTGVVVDEDLLFDDGDYIFSAPYYTLNEGFTNETLLENEGWTSYELGHLYNVLDSVYVAIDEEESEGTIQNIITRGKSRISAINAGNYLINPVHRIHMINTLTQASYSLSLAYSLEDIYGDPQHWIVPCFFRAIHADIEAMSLFQTLGDLDAPGNAGVVAWCSVFTFFDCL